MNHLRFILQDVSGIATFAALAIVSINLVLALRLGKWSALFRDVTNERILALENKVRELEKK